MYQSHTFENYIQKRKEYHINGNLVNSKTVISMEMVKTFKYTCVNINDSPIIFISTMCKITPH